MRIALAVAVAVSFLALASTGAAKGREDVRKAGVCTKSSAAKIKLSEEDGRIEVEFEVDQNRTGVAWRIVLKQRGKVVFQGTRTTRAPSGSFTLRRLLVDKAGPDAISAKATSPSNEVCGASATF